MTEPDQYQEIKLDVQGMTWMSWEPKVVQALEGLLGVKTATAMHPEKKTAVQYDPALVTVGEMCQALLKSGYVASQKEINRTTNAAKPDDSVKMRDHEIADLICYCFGHSRSDIEQDFIENGQSLIMEKITVEKKTGGCDCANKNPKGRWCLSDIRRVVDDIMEKAGSEPLIKFPS